MKKNLIKSNNIFPFTHFEAMLLRRWKLFVRSKSLIIISFLMTVGFSILALIIHYLMKNMIKDKTVPMTFNSFYRKSDNIVILHGSYYKWINPYLEILTQMYLNDTGVYPKKITFSNVNEFNKWVYNGIKEKKNDFFVLFGFEFLRQYPYTFNLFYNSTGVADPFRLLAPDDKSLGGEIMLTRMVWKNEFGINSDFKFSQTFLIKRTVDLAFAFLGSSMITTGLMSIVPLIISQPVADITGDVRDYLISCNLKLLPYWISIFLVDFFIWIFLVTLTWLILLISNVMPIVQNSFSIIYTLIMVGPSFLLMIYCFSFIFSSPESASRNLYFILIILILFPMVIDVIIDGQETPLWIEWLWSMFPHSNLLRIISRIMRRVSVLKKPLSYFFRDKHDKPYLYCHYIGIFFYSFILWIIETFRTYFHKYDAHSTFSSFEHFLKKLKLDSFSSPETIEMEELVNQKDDFAIKLLNVSRVFLSPSGKLIPAVNDITLGIHYGSTFGFLGANGAGKSTLMKIMTSIIPYSSGLVLINGQDISKNRDTTHISVCPQFNSHLIPELTPNEHFLMFSKLYELEIETFLEKKEILINILIIIKFLNKPVRELSGGQQRRLCIALTFLSPADIILLDEPTSSLDPYSRYNVHQLISKYKGLKTILLCTHLLGEAESLCDNLSIMVKGSLYTCGTPQFLSQKFGTEFKIDIVLNDNSISNSKKCDLFFENYLPKAKLSIYRPNSRVYTIPSNSICISELFDILKKGKDNNNGFNYYTCTTSSLEKIFLDIMKIAQTEEFDNIL